MPDTVTAQYRRARRSGSPGPGGGPSDRRPPGRARPPAERCFIQSDSDRTIRSYTVIHGERRLSPTVRRRGGAAAGRVRLSPARDRTRRTVRPGTPGSPGPAAGSSPSPGRDRHSGPCPAADLGSSRGPTGGAGGLPPGPPP
eukprot:748363-Hanusia_phi.AAC.1